MPAHVSNIFDQLLLWSGFRYGYRLAPITITLPRNSLPNRVVMSDNTNIFKNRLDSFWEGQDIIYDFRAQLYGTGSRSEIRIE